LANRLTEDPRFNVLVIEAGPTFVDFSLINPNTQRKDYSNIGIIDSIVPGHQGRLSRSRVDWNFTTVPQKALGGRSMALERGHVLRGSSSVNKMVYTRGPASDYDSFAQITGDPGWSRNNLQKYIRQVVVFFTPALTLAHSETPPAREV
jgi:choline dehydrogenase-like flavoprotein